MNRPCGLAMSPWLAQAAPGRGDATATQSMFLRHLGAVCRREFIELAVGDLNRVHFETDGFSLARAGAVPIFRSSLEQGLSDRCYELTMGAGSRQWRICAIWP